MTPHRRETGGDSRRALTAAAVESALIRYRRRNGLHGDGSLLELYRAAPPDTGRRAVAKTTAHSENCPRHERQHSLRHLTFTMGEIAGRIQL